MERFFRRAGEWFADALFFLAIPAAVLGVAGYLLVSASHAGHPEPKAHWSQGPQDPEPTH